jgi:hypothetical protein
MAIFGLIASAVERHDLRAPKAASEAEQQHGPVPQLAQQTAIERLKHVDRFSGRIASFCLGGAAWVLRMQAITVATRLNLRSRLKPLCA